MERDAAPPDLLNWRFQQALYRAYYDAYVRQRLMHERALEAEAMAALATGAATSARSRPSTPPRPCSTGVDREPAARALRSRVGELAEALFQSIRMQLAVKPYGAIAVGRGATLDTIDMPLNDRVWLSARFREIRALAEGGRAPGGDCRRSSRWTDPGPGGFYDDLGDPTRQPHLVRGPGLPTDPGSFADVVHRLRLPPRLAPVVDDARRVVLRRLGCRCVRRPRPDAPATACASSTPATSTASPPGCGWSPTRPHEVHPWMTKEGQPKPIEFDVPAAATADGGADADLAPGARAPAARAGAIRSREVWLMRAPPRAAGARRDGASRSDAPWGNPLRRRLAAGEPVFGDHHLDAGDRRSRCAPPRMGFDFLWLELEHSPITLETVRHIVLATRGLARGADGARAGQRGVDRETRARCRRARRDLSVHEHGGARRAGGRARAAIRRSAGAAPAPVWRPRAGRTPAATTTRPTPTS